MFWRILLRLKSVLLIAVLLWLCTGAVLRLTGIRDRFDGLAVIFYTTQWLVIGVGLSAISLLWGCEKRRALAGAAGMAAVACFVAWGLHSWCWNNPESGTPRDFRLLLWNVRNNEEEFVQIAARIKALDPDVVALAEAGNHLSNEAKWTAEFPKYSVLRLPRQMLCLSKTPLERIDSGALDKGSYFALYRTVIRGTTIQLLQVDIDARPVRSRRAALANLASKIAALHQAPTLLMGDFNTPRESWHLDPIRRVMRHAFETRGRGFADTWPQPLPFLSLDQIWATPHFEILRCEEGWSALSDHRPVWVDLRFANEKAQP